MVLVILLTACQSAEQEIHYIAKSEHWKAIYHSNGDEGLRLFYLGDHNDLGPLQITIEGAKESQTLDDAQLTKEGIIHSQEKKARKF